MGKSKKDLLIFFLPSLDPLLEQVLIVAVCSGSKSIDPQVGKLPTVGVDEHRHQAVVLASKGVDMFHHPIHCFLHVQTRETHLYAYTTPTPQGKVQKQMD